MLLIGSPMCSAFSKLQSLNRNRMSEEKYEEMIAEGTAHLRFYMKLYRMQIDNGLYFVHEHPDGAKSWDDPVVRKLIEDWRVWKVKGDMCQYGMQQEDKEGIGSVKKRTVFITNAEENCRTP